MSIRSTLVALAASCAGQTDSRPFIREEAPAYGPYDRPSWCGIFVRAIWRRAGLSVPDWKIGSANLTGLTKISNPQPGDLIMWRGTLGHQSMFVERRGDIVVSWDGNTEGGQVAMRERPATEVLAYYQAPVPADNDTIPAPPPDDLLLGVDVSYYQANVNWTRLRELGYSFAIVRGVRMGREVDARAQQHVAGARGAGMQVGLYAFFVPTASVYSQVEVMREAHRICGVGPGDIAPSLDIESYSVKSSPAWAAPVADILAEYRRLWGNAIRYHNVNDWDRIGRPAELEQYPLWLADYTPPADLPCTLWQHKSAPIPGYGSAADMDQNVAHGPLPLIGHPHAAEQFTPPPLFDLTSTVESRRAARDSFLRGTK